MLSINEFIKQVDVYLPNFDRQNFLQLYQYVENLYQGSYRFSGQTYLDHALKVAWKLLPLRPDQATLSAALLLNAHQFKTYNLNEIGNFFGESVKKLVEGLEKLNAIHSRRSNSNVLVVRKMFLNIAEDLRVMIIRLAERVENMETLEFVDVSKQKIIARETLDVYVPIASRLGLYNFKHLLEDLSFKFLFPDQYESLSKEMSEYTSEYEQNIEETKIELENLMKANNFQVMVSGRIKNLFSIYNKLKKKNLTSVYDLTDIYAMRIVVLDQIIKGAQKENIGDLYAILSLLNSKYEPVLAHFKDYLAHPKQNGYQSLHTTIIGVSSRDLSKPTEIQIRTERMHKSAETGLAAHWLYKDKNDFSFKNVFEDDLKWIENVFDLKNSLIPKSGNLKSAKLNFYKDRIFVLTPQNQVKDLPDGATPLDFAYAIHSDLGHAFYLAKVNGIVVPLDYKLKNGEIVEIVTHNKPNPKLGWLTAVKTRLAKNRIKSFFKALNKKSLFDEGREEFNSLLAKMNLPLLDEELTFFKNYHEKRISFEDRKHILEEIGSGVLSSGLAFKYAYGISSENFLSQLKRKSKPRNFSTIFPRESNQNTQKNQLVIGGERDIPFRLSECCKPKLTDFIIAYLTKAKGISIHLQNCKFIKNVDKSRLLEAYLESDMLKSTGKKYNVGLLLEIKQRKGYVSDIVKLSNDNAVKILEFSLLKKENDLIVRRMIVDVGGQFQLEQIIKKMLLITGILKISRI